MNKGANILFFIFFWLACIILFPFFLLVWIATVAFDKRLTALHHLTNFWGSLFLWVAPSWKVKAISREKVDRNKAYVIVSNHQSQLDIFVAHWLFIHFKWVSKVEAFRIPLVGWTMRLNRYIELRRGDKESVTQMMADCERALMQGSSVFIFPEGTRSETGIMRKFRLGGFTIAKRVKVPILPVVINGTRKALPKNSLNLGNKCNITIKVLDEIPYGRFAEMDIEEIAEMVRELISAHVHEHQVSN